jgi:divalent metal cation (Fe/Co/Zn/Cd) transporter
MIPVIRSSQQKKLIKTAFYLSIFTIVYNILEGVFSIYFGVKDETISLAGFGIDSFVEVLSGIGVGHMVYRMKRHPVDSWDAFEKRALYITGISFFILTAGIVTGSVLNIIYGNKPSTTIPGVIISFISIGSMYFLYKYKLKTGRALNSDAIISDANCTKTCFQLSFILLGSSLLYEFFRIGYIDILGGLGIAYFAFREGLEAFEKAKSANMTCGCGGECKTRE